MSEWVSACVRACVHACVCVLRIVSRDKILPFKNTFYYYYYYFRVTDSPCCKVQVLVKSSFVFPVLQSAGMQVCTKTTCGQCARLWACLSGFATSVHNYVQLLSPFISCLVSAYKQNLQTETTTFHFWTTCGAVLWSWQVNCVTFIWAGILFQKEYAWKWEANLERSILGLDRVMNRDVVRMLEHWHWHRHMVYCEGHRPIHKRGGGGVNI